jgi:glycosyltransferase involved in cell wall biosynthesis
MKILTVVHDFNNFGGIISHAEQLLAGFKDLGHETDFIYLRTTKTGGTISGGVDEGYDIGVGTGRPVHQGKGWRGEYLSIINEADIQKFIDKANEFDVVIWQSIFGFKCQETENKTSWLRMITDITPKQIVIVHDGNLRKNYPWIHHFKDKITALACVHPSAFKQAAIMEIPRALIVNPQQIQTKDSPKKFSERKDAIFSLQTFKRWKRVDDLVAAVPYIKAEVIIAGDGIERSYMASKDKCKPEYFCTLRRDPNAQEDLIGKRIWENAENDGMKYIGFVSEQKRDEILSDVKFLLDPSWSKTYGEHFNRVIVDAMKQGVVPIARNLGVSDNEEGVGFFKPDVNYLMIPWNATPKEFGDLINKWTSMSEKEYNAIVQNNNKMLKVFDRKRIAQEYIDLANGKLNTTVGTYDSDYDNTINSVWCGHFGFKNEIISYSSLESLFD